MSPGGLLLASACAYAISVGCDAEEVPTRGASQPTSTHFAIQTQPLATALIAFGKQANLQLLTAGATIANLRSEGVHGAFAADAALARLLQSTDLDFEFINARTVVVKPRRSAGLQSSAAANTLAANIGEVQRLAPVHSTGRVGRDSGYLIDISEGATRTISDIADLPQSVSVITRDLIDSQQIRTVADAVSNVAGVQYNDSSYGLPLFLIRGFYTGKGMINGMPNSIASVGDFPPLIGVERIEVLKGPESILGDLSVDNNFGGLINVVTKKPQRQPVRQWSYAIDERGGRHSGIDLAGPLGSSAALSYRLVLSGEHVDRSTQGYLDQRNTYFAPSIGWRGESTRLTMGLEHIGSRLPIPDHTVLLGDTLASAAPSSLLLGNPHDHSEFRTNRYSFALEHQLGPVWTWRSRGQYVRGSTSIQDWTLYNPMPTGDVGARAESYRYSDYYFTAQNDVIGTFTEGKLEHTVVVGFDYSRTKVGSSDDFFNSPVGVPHNIFAGAPLPLVGSVVKAESDSHDSGSPWSTDSGLFLQDQIAFGTRWDVVLALRRSTYELSTTDADGNPTIKHRTRWVPNAGAVCKITPDISLYGSTSTGFQPDTLQGKNSKPLRPSLSRQIEMGAKFGLLQDRARLTASAYRITLDRSTDLVSLNPPYFAVPGPGQTNKGVEIELSGEIAPGIDIRSSYTAAHIHNHDGTLATGAPRQHGSLWASYRFQPDTLQGWSVAGGVVARSRSLGQTTGGTYFDIPGQASVSANVSYRAGRWATTLGMTNLLDRALHSVDFDETFVPLRRGRTLLLSGTYDFSD